MALVFTNAGELLALEWMVKATTTPEDLILKLYKSDSTPDADSVAASFVEADFTNYAAVTLNRSTWGTATTIGGKASISYDSSAQSYTCGATGNTVYGYYVTGASTGTLIFAERFSVSRVLGEGDTLNVQPVLTLNSEA